MLVAVHPVGFLEDWLFGDFQSLKPNPDEHRIQPIEASHLDLIVAKDKADEEKLMTTVLESGGDDMAEDGDNWEIFTAPDAFQAVLDAVKALGIEPDSAEVSMIPKNYVSLEGAAARSMLKLMDVLDDLDDVQNVWSNFDIEEKEIEALA